MKPSLDSFVGQPQSQPSLDSFAQGGQSQQDAGQLGTLPKPMTFGANGTLPVTSYQGGNPVKSFASAVGDELVGAGKGLASDVIGLSKFGGNIMNKLTFGYGQQQQNQTNQFLDQTQAKLAPTTQSQVFGNALSTAGQMTYGGQAVLKGGSELASKAYTAFSDAKTAKNAAAETAKLAETLAPKPTAKEVKLAQTQGRIYPGKEPTLFKGGTPDKIATSNKTFNATRTVQEQIPNASKLKPAELYNAVDEGLTKKATTLRPQMEATPIKSETVQKINTDWESLKKEQIANAPATEETNVAKRQTKFESLLQKSGSQNHADLWDTRIKYDNSIPDGVKKANINSPESLQLQKEEWLQNRDILNHAINDTASGMGKTSQEAFSDMTNLYEAKNSLLTKAKVNEADPSKIKQWIEKNPKKAGALVGVLGLEGAKLFGLDYRRLLP